MKYFEFKELNERVSSFEELILFAIIVFLVYIWVKLFAYYDR